MNRLIIETSSAQFSVALFRNAELIREEIFPGGRGPVNRLFSILAGLLCEVDKLDEVVVGVGPGSYSGIRIGISAAIGLKLGRGIPVWGVCSVLGFLGTDFQVVLDARGSWTYLFVRNGKLEDVAKSFSQEELMVQLDLNRPVFSDRTIPFVASETGSPLASVLGRRFLDSPSIERLPLEPLYLKPPHITKARSVIFDHRHCKKTGTGEA